LAFLPMVAAGLLVLIPSLVPASSLVGRNMTMPELAKRSDEIVHGTVERVEGKWRNGRVETDSVIVVKEGYKGSKYSLGPGKQAVNKATAPRVTISTIGGTVQGSPITQHAPLMPFFVPGEEVILFLRYPEADPAKRDKAFAAAPQSRLILSPRVVGLFQGKFTVITHPDTGRRTVARLPLEKYDIAPTEPALKAVIQGLALGRIPTTSGTLVAQYPDLADRLGSLQPVQYNLDTTQSVQRLSQSARTNPIPLMDLDAFVNQIQQNVR
jgi:hypothetical protein